MKGLFFRMLAGQDVAAGPSLKLVLWSVKMKC